MKVSLNRINDDYLFECTNEAGSKILMDNTSQPNAKGVSPMESLVMAAAACSGIDIISILKKQRQEITSFNAEVEGERIPVDEAKPFSHIKFTFNIEGAVDPAKALKAAELSFQKYCSVTKTLEPNVTVSFEVTVNGHMA